MEILRRFLFTSIGRKMIMAVTGFCLAGFLLVHVLGNSSIFFGSAAFNSYARHLHSLGPLIVVFELILLALFCCHIFFAVLLFRTNRAARPTSYMVRANAGGRSLGSGTMFYSGLVILTFLLFHLFTIHFVDHHQPISVIISREFARLSVVAIYCAGVIALGIHLSHGLWSLWQSMGINHPLYNGLIRAGAWFFTLFIAAVFFLLPLLGLFWPGFLS